MSSVQVKFFASLRERVGRAEMTLPLNEPRSVAEVWAQACGDLAMPANTLAALNQDYVGKDALVRPGDEVAFFPPVTGG